jgi:hypothetical protein
MTTEAIAKRLVELFNEGKAVEAEKELYADDVASYEQHLDTPVRGLDNIVAKTTAAFANAETVNRAEATKYAVNNDTFVVTFEMDMEMKDGSAIKGTEYGFYSVLDGKISKEHFFMI